MSLTEEKNSEINRKLVEDLFEINHQIKKGVSSPELNVNSILIASNVLIAKRFAACRSGEFKD